MANYEREDCDLKEKRQKREAKAQKRAPRKGGRKEGNEKKEDRSMTLTNNPAWYAASKEDLEMYTRLSDNVIAGRPISNWSAPNPFTIKNIMRVAMGLNIKSNSNYGDGTHDVWSGVNAGSRKLYQELTAFTGRAASSYSSNDLTILTVCLGSLLEMISYTRRAIGTFRLAATRDRSYPKAICQSMGLNYDVEVEKLGDNIKRFNTILDRTRGLVIPQNPFLIKCAQMYDYYFLDDQTDMSQVVVTMPRTRFILNEELYEGGSMACALENKGTEINIYYGPNKGWSIDGMITAIEQMINALMTSTTIAVVFADLINFASKKNDLQFLTINNMPYDYVAPVVYSEEFIMQLHNARFFGDYKGLKSYMDADSNGSIYSEADADYVWQKGILWFNTGNGMPQYASVPFANIITRQNILDFNTPNPSSELMVEATRYQMCVYESKLSGTDVVTDRYTGGDHIVLFETYHGVSDTSDLMGQNQDRDWDICSNTWAYDIAERGSGTHKQVKCQFMANLLAIQSGYKCAPNMIVNTSIQASDSGKIENVSGSLSYWKTYDHKYLDVLNDRIMQFMFSFY